MNVGFRQDTFCQATPDGREAKGATDVKRQVAELVAEAEEGLHTGEGAIAAGSGQIIQRVGKVLKIRERY